MLFRGSVKRSFLWAVAMELVARIDFAIVVLILALIPY